ncbi:MAG: hypothetical protein AB1401_11330 [Thermodesulfobacteriota bacterium]
MKCPKCGFTSFDYLDNCKRCGTELLELKKNLNILSVVPRAGSRDEFQTKLDAGVPEVQAMIDTMDSFIQPDPEALKEEPVIEAIDHEIEDQEGMVLEDLPEIEAEDKEDLEIHIDLGFEDKTEKLFSMEVGLEGETAEKEADAEIVLTEISAGDESSEEPLKLELEEPSVLPELTLEEGLEEFSEEKGADTETEIELPEVSTGDEISIGLEDSHLVEPAQSEEDIELSPLEIESPTEVISFPEQQEENIETINLDPINIEVIEFEEEEPSSDEESK